MDLHIALFEPEIPQNTGNIARSCAALGATLHLIRPFPFSVSEKAVRRAGLDYWDQVTVKIHENRAEFFGIYPERECWFSSASQGKNYTQALFTDHTVLVFGCESKGLDRKLLERNKDHVLHIPMLPGIRSLNLSNAVAILAYSVTDKINFSFDSNGSRMGG